MTTNIAEIFNAHCTAPHNADFEVCKHPNCCQQIEILGPNGKVHYRRPANHVDLLLLIAETNQMSLAGQGEAQIPTAR